jgi:thiol-disulfide isomerase/thioredoxin
MKAIAATLIICTALLPLATAGAANQKPLAEPNTVSALYPDLTGGALTFARPARLPKGVILGAPGLQIKAAEIVEFIRTQPEQVRQELTKNALFILEQQATQKLLLQIARKSLPGSTQSPDPAEQGRIIRQYLEESVLKDLKVTDAEAEQFYNQNKDMFGGANLDQVREPLKTYLLEQKKGKTVSDYIRTIGRKINIRIDAQWLKKQAALAKDNPVDKARGSGKPSLVDFGATGCKPCDMLAPILEDIKKKYTGRLNVVFVHVGQNQILASRYGVQSIPVQIFYDKTGREILRHIGFFPQDQIEKQLLEMGVK